MSRNKYSFRPVKLSDSREMATWVEPPQNVGLIGDEPDYEGQRRAVRGWLDNPDTKRFAMRFGGKLIGVGNLERQIPVHWIGWYIAPAHREKGHGRKLAEFMIAEARKQHLGGVVAHIPPENFPALRLALSLRFVAFGFEADMRAGHAVVRLALRFDDV